MTDLTINAGLATTAGPANIKWLSCKKQMEGRVSIHKNGVVSFQASGHNLEVWRSIFPDCKVVSEDVFEEFVNQQTRQPFAEKRESLWWQAKAIDKMKRVISTPSMKRCFALNFDPGGGKSKSLVDFSAMLWSENKIDAVVVLSPNMLVAEQWEMPEDGAIARDCPVPYVSWLWDKTKKGYAEFERLLASNDLQYLSMNIDAAKTPRGIELLTKFIKRHKGRVLFTVDEAHLIGNPQSQRHKKCVDLGFKCAWRAALTGTPITKDLLSYYAIFRFLHPDILGCKYVSTFRAKYCVLKWNGFADEIVGYKNIDDFYARIEPYTARVSQKEMGLEKLYDEFIFTMSEEQKSYYNEFKREWLAKLDNGEFATASIALSATIKLQQISNGYLVSEDGTIQHLDNARLKALDAWLETIPEGEKVVIWVRFREDARLVTAHLGDCAIEISGNVDNKMERKERFLNDPKLTRLVATPDAAGTGMDSLQHVTQRAIFYSNAENFVNRKQAEDRVLRVGGKSTAFITDLICKGSHDRKFLANLRGKKELSRMTLDEVRGIFE